MLRTKTKKKRKVLEKMMILIWVSMMKAARTKKTTVTKNSRPTRISLMRLTLLYSTATLSKCSKGIALSKLATFKHSVKIDRRTLSDALTSRRKNQRIMVLEVKTSLRISSLSNVKP